ncbi:MAG: radical SAM protein [Methanotrichaceae archaeon]|nr:radical SAM protein [Methanotrichaceae archaeon]
MQIAEKPLLRIDATPYGKSIKLSPQGPLAPLAWPFLEIINKIFKDEKPIINGPDKFIFSTWVPPVPSLGFNRMLSAQISSIIGRKVPDQLSVAVIRACPNDCIHCSAPSRKGEILSDQIIIKTIQESLALGTYLVTFDGGEPLLRDSLPQLVSCVGSRAIAASFSSGYGLTDDLAQLFKQAGLYALRISIDSPYQDEHDRIRGRKGAFKDAINGIKTALRSGLLVDLFMVTSPMNIDSLEDAFCLASDLGVHELSLYEIVAVGRWASHQDDVLSPNDVRKMEKFHREKNRSDGPRVTSLPYIMGEKMFGCFAGRRWIHIDASGKALPCAYMPFSFGNVKEMQLKDIWDYMSRYGWFSKKCSCQMKDNAFRHAHGSKFLSAEEI